LTSKKLGNIWKYHSGSVKLPAINNGKKPFEAAPTMNDWSPLDISFVDKLINLEWNPKIWLSNTLWYTNIAIENCHL